MSQLSVSFNVRDGGRALVPRMVSSVARQNTPGCRLDLDNLNEIWGQSRFRWNAILSSWHSNELKTARLSIPYYPLILLYSLIFTLPLLSPPPPPAPSSSRDEISRALVFFVCFTPDCCPESLLSHSSFPPGNGKKEILVLLYLKKIRKFSRTVVLETASHKVSQQIWDHYTFLGKPTYSTPKPTICRK